MAEEGTFCINADVLRKAGANANSTATAEAYTNVFILDAESFINILTRKNWTDAYAGLNADVKYILREAASCLAAIYAINYDMSGFTSMAEAETMLDVLRDGAERSIGLLADQKSVTYTNGA